MVSVKCPTCGKQIEYESSEYRPFCSERCKLLDFGAWAEESYALPSEVTSLTPEELEEIERAREKEQ